MPSYEIKKQTPNVSNGVNERKIVVLHHAGRANFGGVVSWLTAKESRVSAHAVIGKEGELAILADTQQITWHAGRSSYKGRRDVNKFGIGVEFEGDTTKAPLTEGQLNTFWEYWCRFLAPIGLTAGDVTDHRTIAPGRKIDLHPAELERVQQFIRQNEEEFLC